MSKIFPGLDLGWIYLFTGVLVASAVIPVALRSNYNTGGLILLHDYGRKIRVMP